jgi:hypothetical protein
MNPRHLLFASVKPLPQFTYEDIRDFAWGALNFLSQKASKIKSLALTIHGANYGLDEVEAFNSEIAGIIDTVSNDCFPSTLESIAFVEKDKERAGRLEGELTGLFPNGVIWIDNQGSLTGGQKDCRGNASCGGIGLVVEAVRLCCNAVH